MNLAELLRDADPDQELSPDQPGIFDGKPVTVHAALERTCVIELNRERVLVRLETVDIPDPSLLRWQKKPPFTKAAYASRRRGQQRRREGAR